jgi:hypothetical protein
MIVSGTTTSPPHSSTGTGGDDLRLAISVFPAPALTSTTPTRRELPWPTLVEQFRRHERWTTKEGWGWSPATYPAGKTRLNDNVEALSCAVGDFDGCAWEELAAVKARLSELGLAALVYSSYNNAPPDDVRFRIIVPFTRPVPRDAWPDLWLRINQHLFGGRNDPATKDCSRFYYPPSAPPDVAVFAEVLEGGALDPGVVPPAPTSSPAAGNGEVQRGAVEYLGYPSLEFLALGAPPGQQRLRAVATARALLAAGKPPEDATALVWQGLQHCALSRPGEPWTEADAQKIVASVAKTKPPPLTALAALAVPAAAAASTKADDAPLTLADVVQTFRRWLYLPDFGALYAVLGTVAANHMATDPVWLMLVGASGGGKTEVLNTIRGLPHIYEAATLTEGALLSGTARRDADKRARGGLLREIGAFGILLCKDFTSVLSMNRDPRAALLAALREVYDGSWTRHVGIDGGRTLHWEGKLGLLAGCTSTIDGYHSVMAAMGERFLLYRLPEIDAHRQGRRALGNIGREREMRGELAAVVRGFFDRLELPAEPPPLTEQELQRLVALAALAARCRSPVERDGRTHEIELIPDPEAPARLAQALRRLHAGLRVIGLSQQRAWRVLVHTALDCMPQLRRRVFMALTEDQIWRDTTAIATRVNYPTITARRALEDLAVHSIVEREVQGAGRSDLWSLTAWARAQYSRVVEPLTEKSVETVSADNPSYYSSLHVM